MTRRAAPWLLSLLFVSCVALHAAPAPWVRAATHVGLTNTFDLDLSPLAPRPAGADEPPTVELARIVEAGRGGVARMTNRVSGGFVGLNLLAGGPPLPVPVRLAFDYRADPRLKANLFVRVQSVDYEIGLWGPRSDLGQAVWLGQIETAPADGEWHRLEIPLLGLLRAQLPQLDQPRLTELYLANHNTGDYLLAGFGGNQAGTTLDLDNFELWRPGGLTADVVWQAEPNQPVETWAVVLDDQPTTVPAEGQVPAGETSRSFADLAPGDHWLHVRSFAGGLGSETAHYRLSVATAPPTGRVVEPALGAAAAPAAVRFAFDSPAGIDPRSLRVRLGDDEWAADARGVSLDAAAGELRVDLAALAVTRDGASVPLTLPDGQEVALSVTASDENGLALAEPLTARFTLDRAHDTTPPRDARLALRWSGEENPSAWPGDGTFEQGVDEWMPHGAEPVMIERTTAQAAAGRYSLRLVCGQNGSNFTVYVRRSAYDLSRFRVISFDYLADPRLRLDFLFLVSTPLETRYLRVVFADRDRDGAIIGSVPDVILNRTWQHAEFNLYDMVRQALPDHESYTVQGVLLSGGRWTDSPQRFAGNYAGTEVYFDNFFFVPTVSTDAALEWQGYDLSRLTAARVAAAPTLDGLPGPNAAADAGRLVEGPSTNLVDYGSGLTYLWVRPIDGRGNMGEPLITRVVLASGRPEVVRTWPGPDGARVAPQPIGIALRYDRSVGIDLPSVQLEVGGLVYSGQSATIALDNERGELTWSGLRSQPQVVLADGQEVQVRLLALQDQAGNSPEALPAWRFTVDYGEDRTGPRVDVGSRTHTAVWTDQLTDETPRWTPADAAATVAPVELPGSAGWGVAVEPAADGTDYRIVRRLNNPYSLLRFGFLYFEYNLDANEPIDLVLTVGPPPGTTEGEVVEARVQLRPAAELARAIAAGDRAVEIVPDGTWRALVVPLAEVLRGGNMPANPYIQAIAFAPRDPQSVRAGAGWAFAAPRAIRAGTSPTARVVWSATDETSVTGYATLLDQNPHSLPPTDAVTQETEVRIDALPGALSWYHVRAQDGAGNWGPVEHFPLYVPPVPGG